VSIPELSGVHVITATRPESVLAEPMRDTPEKRSMIKAISYWSVRNGGDATRPWAEAVADAKAAGFEAIEAAVGTQGILTPATDQATCEAYRKAAAEAGVRLETVASGMSWAASPSDPDESVRRRAIDLHREALQRTAWLGAKALLFVPGAVKIPWDRGYGPVRYDLAVRWAREATKELAETAEKLGVDLCVENVWNGLFYSPLEFASFVDEIGSERVGVYLDIGNVMGYHQHPPHWIEILGKRIKRVHIKDYDCSKGGLSGFCDLLAGDVPWPETMAALRSIGYDGTLVAEMMPYDPQLLERTSKAMDKILSM
jgi:L-ribulose-5-phosphate 3-epimerase